MTKHSYQTAPTQFVEANGIRFAYRRFGAPYQYPDLFVRRSILFPWQRSDIPLGS